MDRPTYLDHHATTPVDPRVLEAMLPCFTEDFGNPDSRTHALGRRARERVEVARAEVAALLDARPDEIVFTSGATESDRLAILGVVRAHVGRRPHVITQATEHKAVLGCLEALAGDVDLTVLGVDGTGRVDPDAVSSALRPDTVLVSVMLANNEIGTAQDIGEIARRARARGVLVHCDAAQGLGYLPLDVRGTPVDLVSLSGHKMYGPKGVGALYVRRGTRLSAPDHGGGQERGLRPGTLNVPGIVGLGRACALLAAEGAAEATRLVELRDRLRDALATREGVSFRGSFAHRHPGNLSVAFEGVSAETLLTGVGDALAFSSGSACSTGSSRPSHVLLALGLDEAAARATVRFGLGRGTTAADVDAAAETVLAFVDGTRARSPEHALAAAGIDPSELEW